MFGIVADPRCAPASPHVEKSPMRSALTTLQSTFMRLASSRQVWLPPTTLTLLWWLLLVAAVVIIGLANFTTIDVWLADRAFDVATQRFQAKHTFIYETLLHDEAKKALAACFVLISVLCLLPVSLRPAWLTPGRHQRLCWVAVLAVINSVLVAWLKSHMPHGCPWDIDRYGGSLPLIATFSWHPLAEQGHCFPAGHATSALWLATFCLFWLPHAPRRALWVALGGLAAGAALGWAQQLRGAHFLSHTLTAVWIMCALLLIVLSYTSPKKCDH